MATSAKSQNNQSELSKLQYFVLTRLVRGQKSGQSLREDLASNGMKRTGPGFYQIMYRLLKGGLIEVEEKPIILGGKQYREKHYRITDKGVFACEEHFRFAITAAPNVIKHKFPITFAVD
jgi:DNA-binding PadR family transcriptional regulator